MMSKNNLLFILYYCGLIAALVAVLAFAVITNTFGLVLLTSHFEDEFKAATNETGLNFLLVEHSDQSVTLYAQNNDTTAVVSDGIPDRMSPLAGYASELALYGAYGVKDAIEKVPVWRNLNLNLARTPGQVVPEVRVPFSFRVQSHDTAVVPSLNQLA
jgi:hypothetical protein